MNKRIKRMTKLFVIVIAILLGSFGYFAFAENLFDAKMAQIKNDLEKLQKIEDDITIPNNQKEEAEISLRKSIISNIVDISLSQLDDVENKLASTTFPESEQWQDVYHYLKKLLEKDRSYYLDVQSKINESQNISLDEIKKIAKSLESEKSSNMDADLTRANNVIAQLNFEPILAIATERLNKVKNDVNRIYSNKLTQNRALKDLLDEIEKNIKEASQFSDAAKQSILVFYTSTTTTSSTQETAALIKDKILEKKISSILTESPEADTSQIKVSLSDIDSYITQNITQAYNNIKSAYEKFIKMSTSIKKLIQ